MQILVVVATIQMRTLNTEEKRKVSCEQQLDMSESILRDRVNPFQRKRVGQATVLKKLSHLSKGNQVNIPEPKTRIIVGVTLQYVVTQKNHETSMRKLGRVIFSF